MVFAGGIGERSVELRAAVADKLKCLGYSGVGGDNGNVDSKPDQVVIDISEGTPETKRLLVCRTDEQVGPFAIHLL